MGLTVACSDDDDDLPEVDCDAGPVPTYTEIKTPVFGKCTVCHSSTLTGPQRVDAPADVNFDTYAAAKAEAEEAAEEVNEGEMPPTGFPAPSAAEQQLLYKWALCGTPE